MQYKIFRISSSGNPELEEEMKLIISNPGGNLKVPPAFVMEGGNAVSEATELRMIPRRDVDFCCGYKPWPFFVFFPDFMRTRRPRPQ